MDWLKSSNKQRVSLHDAVIRLIRLRQMKWEDIYNLMGLDPKNPNTAFHENFRKGKISKARAALIYQYLSDHHAEAIPALDAAVSTASLFWQFLLYYRRLGALEILPDMISVPFRSNRLGPEWRDFPFEAGDPICFRLRLPQIYPHCCALNGGLEGWYPIVLQEPTDCEFLKEAPPEPQTEFARYWLPHLPFITLSTQGSQTICSAPPTRIEHRRRCRDNNMFVFLAGDFDLLYDVTRTWQVDTRISDSELDRLASRFLETRWRDGWSVAQLNAHGMGPPPEDD